VKPGERIDDLLLMAETGIDLPACDDHGSRVPSLHDRLLDDLALQFRHGRADDSLAIGIGASLGEGGVVGIEADILDVANGVMSSTIRYEIETKLQ
jgi:hypothetical protein